jgi:dTMP kinase
MFITLEGIEGCGKTTQVAHIIQWVRAAGHACLATREPGGTPIGSQIRSVLLDPSNDDLVPTAELMLYLADRVQHLETVVRPAVQAGKVVICDRFFDATMVYQGYARGLDKAVLRRLHQLACGGMMPDLTLLLDVDVKIGLNRAWRRIQSESDPGKESRFEKETLAFHQRVRDGYLDLARRDPRRFVIIDAAVDESAVRRQMEAALATHIK